MIQDFMVSSQGVKKEFVTAEQCFAVLTDEQKDKLIANRRIIDFEVGETIIKRGYIASSILFLEDGLAKLDVLIDGKSSTISLVPPRSFIGIVCSFACHDFSFSSIALEKTKISLYDMELFEEFIQTNGKFAHLLIKHMSLITNSLVHHTARFIHKNIEGSLSLLLLEFSHIYKSNKFVLPLNRIELAHMIGYSKESVINSLSRLNKEGILKVHEKSIEILDIDKLSKISKNG